MPTFISVRFTLRGLPGPPHQLCPWASTRVNPALRHCTATLATRAAERYHHHKPQNTSHRFLEAATLENTIRAYVIRFVMLVTFCPTRRVASVATKTLTLLTKSFVNCHKRQFVFNSYPRGHAPGR